MYQAGTIRRAGDDSGIYEVEAMRRDAETVIQKTIEDVLPMKQCGRFWRRLQPR